MKALICNGTRNNYIKDDTKGSLAALISMLLNMSLPVLPMLKKNPINHGHG